MKREIITYRSPKNPISEIFRTLRTNIQFMSGKRNLKTLLVTSTSPGEGKSWVSANLAVTFAQTGKKVILVDADMRKGRQYSIFEVSPRPGLSNYLSGIGIDNEEEAENIANYIQETEIENLYVMPAGNIPPNPSELLVSEQMVDLLEKLKQICDMVILDGTPSTIVTDALILTRFVDTTLIVTASEKTKRENLQKIITNIKDVGGNVAGVVLNKMPISVKSYKESYYYGSTEKFDNKKQKKSEKRNGIPTTDLRRSVRSNGTNIKNLNIQRLAQEKSSGPKRMSDEPKERNSTLEKSTVIDNDKTLKREIDIDTKEASLERTKDILNQINSYLESDKNN